MSDKIFYKSGYRYQLTRPYSIQTGICPPATIDYPYWTLHDDGLLEVSAGFAWDGASGPTFDTRSSMRPSLVHDCFCQMAKDRRLDYNTYAPQYNALFRKMCEEDGMWKLRAKIWQVGVIFGRGGDPDIADDNVEQVAP
jgi:hypothetical protein